jgi:hypothetical protein
MARNPPTTGVAVRYWSRPIYWWSPAGLSLLAGLGGSVVAGAVGLIVGLFGGWVAASRPRAVLLGAGLFVLAAMTLTILEQPLNVSEVGRFPEDHRLANAAGAIAGVLLLAGLAGLLAHRDYPVNPEAAAKLGAVEERSLSSAVAPIVAATLLAAFTLGRLGDRSWGDAALPLAVVVLILAAACFLALRPRPAARSGHDA